MYYLLFVIDDFRLIVIAIAFTFSKQPIRQPTYQLLTN